MLASSSGSKDSKREMDKEMGGRESVERGLLRTISGDSILVKMVNLELRRIEDYRGKLFERLIALGAQDDRYSWVSLGCRSKCILSRRE